MQKMIKNKRHLVNEARAFINQAIKNISNDRIKYLGIKKIICPSVKTMGSLQSIFNIDALACLYDVDCKKREEAPILLSCILMFFIKKDIRKWVYLHELSHYLVYLKNGIRNSRNPHNALFRNVEKYVCGLHNITFKKYRGNNDYEYPDEVYVGKKLVAKRTRGNLIQSGKSGKKLFLDMNTIEKECNRIVKKLKRS